MDRYLAHAAGALLRNTTDPLVIDLGYGASSVTAVELADRLASLRSDIRVLGLEIDPLRVAAALPDADPPRLDFRVGGFEFAGERPTVVRAANVLRQYPEDAALAAWTTMLANLAPGGLLIEGTCDEIGRRGSWVTLDASGPLSLTFACKVDEISRPSDLAERLPKALIHRNVQGEAIHDFLRAFDAAWAVSAPQGTFGARQRWIASCESMASSWPVHASRSRWRHGEITVDWAAVAPIL
jgi:hypothetical protein